MHIYIIILTIILSIHLNINKIVLSWLLNFSWNSYIRALASPDGCICCASHQIFMVNNKKHKLWALFRSFWSALCRGVFLTGGYEANKGTFCCWDAGCWDLAFHSQDSGKQLGKTGTMIRKQSSRDAGGTLGYVSVLSCLWKILFVFCDIRSHYFRGKYCSCCWIHRRK